MTTEPTDAELADFDFWLKDAASILRANGTTRHAEWVEKAATRLRSDPPVDEPDLREAGDTQVRARELLASEVEKTSAHAAAHVRRGESYPVGSFYALRAIERALSTTTVRARALEEAAYERAAEVAEHEASLWGKDAGSSARVAADRIRRLAGKEPS